MSLVTQLVLLAVFAAAGGGIGELVAPGSWFGRIAGALGGLFAGLAVRDLIADKLGPLEDDAPREPPTDRD